MTVTAEIEKWNALQEEVQKTCIGSAFRVFRSVDIEPILIKGWAAARNYPSTHRRRPGDIDLAVDPNDFLKAQGLLKTPAVGKLFIDLHEGLRLLDTIPWQETFAKSVLVDVMGERVRVLSPEDHLRVIAPHWLIDGGRFKDKLWDIYYAVANRPADFDWERCLSVVDRNRRGWVTCAIAIAHKYLDLPINDLPIAEEASSVPSWISRCIEKEWARRDLLEPVLVAAQHKDRLFVQIGRRLPPNPVRATIEADGDLYGRRRWLYQIQVLQRRAVPFLRDSVKFARMKLRSEHN